MKEKRIAIVLLEGFEEIEAITPFDVLKRLGFDVVLAGDGREYAEGSHGLRVSVSTSIERLREEDLDCLLLPGGMPGSLNLKNNPAVIELVKRMNEKRKILAAICAAPIALGAACVLKGRRITSHPSVKDQIPDAVNTGARTELDQNIVTGKGPGASFEFARRIAASLGKKAEAEKLTAEMFVE